MIDLLLALATLTPQKAWEQELLCWDGSACRPRVVNLGSWDPAPAPKDWPGDVPLNAPKPWAPDETGLGNR